MGNAFDKIFDTIETFMLPQRKGDLIDPREDNFDYMLRRLRNQGVIVGILLILNIVITILLLNKRIFSSNKPKEPLSPSEITGLVFIGISTVSLIAIWLYCNYAAAYQGQDQGLHLVLLLLVPTVLSMIGSGIYSIPKLIKKAKEEKNQ